MFERFFADALTMPIPLAKSQSARGYSTYAKPDCGRLAVVEPPVGQHIDTRVKHRTVVAFGKRYPYSSERQNMRFHRKAQRKLQVFGFGAIYAAPNHGGA